MKLYFFLVIYLCCLTSHFEAKEDISSILGENNSQKSDNLTVVEKWKNLEERVKKVTNNIVKMILPELMKSQETMNISAQCMKEGMQLIAGVRKIKPWAFRFLDSSAKMVDGMLTGSTSSFGDYDECINTIVTSERSRDRGKIDFRGQYCTIDFKLPLPTKPKSYKIAEVLEELKNFSEGGTAVSEAAKFAQFFYFLSLRFGVCVPSGCTANDITQVAQMLGDYLSVNANVSRCEMKEENNFTPLIIFVISVYSFTGFLMLVGSLLDIFCYYKKVVFNNTALKIFMAFSLFTNFRKISNTDTACDALRCLSGVRFLCMTWIVLGHTYFVVNFQMFLGLQKAKAYAEDFAFQAVINATVAVDTFFFMGGMLVCYLAMKLVKIGGHPFSLKLYIFHRLWRIIPIYIYVIMFMFIATLFGSGPMWHESTDKFLQACDDNWWSNLIFINNFYNSDNMCIPQSWYIACDFQLYVAALLIVLPLLRWPKVGITLNVLAILASVVYSGVGTYVYDYPPAMLIAHPDLEQRLDYWARFYFRPFVHAGPYAIGILAGYLLATKPDLKIPRRILVVGWCVAFICSFSALYGVAEWNKGVEPTFWGGIIYASLNRVAWTLGVAWMIVCCITGHGGVINYILSWKAFVPLSRLTFIVYLIHPVVQTIVVANIRTQLQPDHFFAVWVFFGHLCITYGIAFAGSMLVEAPFLALEKIILPRPVNKGKDTPIGNLKGILTPVKKGDLAVIVPDTTSECNGIDNNAIVYKL